MFWGSQIARVDERLLSVIPSAAIARLIALQSTSDDATIDAKADGMMAAEVAAEIHSMQVVAARIGWMFHVLTGPAAIAIATFAVSSLPTALLVSDEFAVASRAAVLLQVVHRQNPCA